MAKVVSERQASAALLPPPAYADLVEFGRDTLEGVRADAALAAGLEAFGQELARYARAAFATAGETARGLLEARTFEDVVRLQTGFAKRSFEDLVARSAKLAEFGRSLFDAGVDAWDARARI